MYVLFPGRHHLLTNFQLEYLTRVVSGDLATLLDVDGKPLGIREPIAAVLWAVTSANHDNTRRNPLSANRREAAIEEFATQLDVDSFVFLIDDVGATPRFAEYVLKKIEVDSQGRFRLHPDNTLLACSTPAVIEMYERLGFRILPVELTDRRTGAMAADPPWRVLDGIVQRTLDGADWRIDDAFLRLTARATRRLYLKYQFGDRIVDLHRSELLTDDGDLTDTRDYNTYVRSFDEGAARKYELVKELVRPGRIVDIGCCTGALLRELTGDDRLRESDFYGIEVARPLYAECLHRKQQGGFHNDNVFFLHRDFAAGPVFSPHSVDTFTTFALTHEIESYAGRDALERFMGLLRGQLASRGRWLNVDVVGPDDPEARVWLWLNAADGDDDDPEQAFAGPGQRQAQRDYLDRLSTLGRFRRFARDFRRAEGYALAYELERRAEGVFAVLALRDACEFLSKKDYTDNWTSEMHETFCFWSFDQWRQAAVAAGFRVLAGSRNFANPWIVEHRYRGRAELFEERAGELVRRDYPPTTMVLVAESDGL